MMPKITLPISPSWRPLPALRTNYFQPGPDGAARARRDAQSDRATPARWREAFDRQAPECHMGVRRNNGKEVIQCLTLWWRVGQDRRLGPWSRPPGSADAAEKLFPTTKSAQPPRRVFAPLPSGGGASHF
jgi:hypothetical protein